MYSWSHADLLPAPPLSKHAKVREGACSPAKSTLREARTTEKGYMGNLWGEEGSVEMMMRQPQVIIPTLWVASIGKGLQGLRFIGSSEMVNPSINQAPTR